MRPEITVFGATNCEDTRRTRMYLASHGYHFSYINVDEDKNAEQMLLQASEGERRTPYVVVQFAGEVVTLSAPSNEKLEGVLRYVGPLQKAA